MLMSYKREFELKDKNVACKRQSDINSYASG